MDAEFPKGYTFRSTWSWTRTAGEVVLHTEPTANGYSTALKRAYGTGKLPIPLADGRTFTLDLDELPRPEPETDTH